MSVRLARNPRSQSPEPAFKLAGMRTRARPRRSDIAVLSMLLENSHPASPLAADGRRHCRRLPLLHQVRLPVETDYSCAIVSRSVSPRVSRAEYVRQLRARRVNAGRCKDCGRRRYRFKWRCVKCQAAETKRWRRKYPPRFWSMPLTPAQRARRNRKRLADFLRQLERA